MPNHVKNKLFVKDNGGFEKLCNLLKSEKSEVDFNNLVKMPEILTHTISGSRTFTINGEEIAVKSWYIENQDAFSHSERMFTGEELQQLQEIGHLNCWAKTNKNHIEVFR